MKADIRQELLQFMKEYLTLLQYERRLAENTIQAYRNDITQFLAYMEDKEYTDFEEVNPGLLNGFFTLLFDVGISERSAARYYSSLNGFFGYLFQSGYITANPIEKINSPKLSKSLPEVLTIDEVNAILEQPDTSAKLGIRDRAMLEVLYACGLRVSELTGLKQANLFLDQEVIRVLGKGSKERFIPIGSSAIEWLTKYLEESRVLLQRGLKSADIVFLNARGTQLSRMGVWKIIDKYAKAAKIQKDVHPHTFRHSFATHLLEGGANLRAVQEMLGHTDISVTQIYTHIDRNFVKEEHRLHHPRG